MVAREDYDCSRLREQLDDLVQIISTLVTQRARSFSLLSFPVPQHHSSDQSCLGLIFRPPSAFIQKVAFVLPSGGPGKSSKQPETYKVQNPALPTLPPRKAKGLCPRLVGGMALGLETVALSTLRAYNRHWEVNC